MPPNFTLLEARGHLIGLLLSQLILAFELRCRMFQAFPDFFDISNRLIISSAARFGAPASPMRAAMSS